MQIHYMIIIEITVDFTDMFRDTQKNSKHVKIIFSFKITHKDTFSVYTVLRYLVVYC